MKTIVFASMNPKKVVEIQRMAPDCVKILCLNDIPAAVGVPQAEENGSTFLENATIKAKYWSKKLSMPVLAEDSGICIDVLNGYPGVFTKRCVEQLCPGSDVDSGNPDELYPLLLKLIAESDKPDTTARWYSSMAYVDGDFELYSTHFLLGNMCSRAGDRKFGFDQYFMPVGTSRTLAEMEPEEKDSIGPRLKAFEDIYHRLVGEYSPILKEGEL